MISKLRWIVAVTCLLATACLAILWMRSFDVGDEVGYVTKRYYWEAVSVRGALELRYTPQRNDAGGWFFMPYNLDQSRPDSYFPSPELNLRNWSPSIVAPYWLLVAAGGITGLGLLSHWPFRFSLRMMAIAATMIVIMLACGVAASQVTYGLL